jgi:hypothetical protein
MTENEFANSDLSDQVKPGDPQDKPNQTFEIDIPEEPEELEPPPYAVEVEEDELQVEAIEEADRRLPPDWDEEPPALEAKGASKRGRRKNSGAWLGGLVMIVMGLVFLFQNTTGRIFTNWWALFILIPAFSALSGAWRAYRQGGFNSRVTGGLVGGLNLLLVALIFLLNWNWGRVWPLFLIVIGGGALLGGFARDDDDD